MLENVNQIPDCSGYCLPNGSQPCEGLNGKIVIKKMFGFHLAIIAIPAGTHPTTKYIGRPPSGPK